MNMGERERLFEVLPQSKFVHLARKLTLLKYELHNCHLTEAGASWYVNEDSHLKYAFLQEGWKPLFCFCKLTMWKYKHHICEWFTFRIWASYLSMITFKICISRSKRANHAFMQRQPSFTCSLMKSTSHILKRKHYWKEQ